MAKRRELKIGKLLDDKEIGKLWAQVIRAPGLQNNVDPRLFVDLIRKLVDERIGNAGFQTVNEALEEFGINPETWED